MKVIKNLFIISILVILFFRINSFFAWSAMSSSNYQIFADNFNMMSDNSLSSSNYLMVSSAGEISMGKSNSNSYVLDSGTASIYREPSISMAVSVDHIDFGVLSSTVTAYNSHSLDVFSNSRHGYVLRVYADDFANSSGDTIDFIGSTAKVSTAGTEQFGINLVANTNPTVGANPSLRAAVLDSDYGTSNYFAFADGDSLATANTFSKDSFTVSYIVNISEATIAGQYSTKITYSLSSDF